MQEEKYEVHKANIVKAEYNWGSNKGYCEEVFIEVRPEIGISILQLRLIALGILNGNWGVRWARNFCIDSLVTVVIHLFFLLNKWMYLLYTIIGIK
jgi:hypothetical protein